MPVTQVSASWCGAPEELDALLLDLGTWGYHVAVALHTREAQARNAAAPAPGTLSNTEQQQQQQAQVEVRQTSAPQQEAQEAQEEVVGGSSLEAGAQRDRSVTHGSVRGPADSGHVFIPGRLARLGVHLLRHAAACGWPATTNHLAVDLARTVYRVAPAGAAAPAAVGCEQPESTEAAVVQGDGGGANRQVRAARSEAEKRRGEHGVERRWDAVEGVAMVSAKAESGSGSSSAAAVRRTAGSRPRTSVQRALWQAVGLGHADAAEEEAYQAYAAPLIFAQGMVL